MKCFVIMPYGNRAKDPERGRELDEFYEQLIKPAVEAVSVPGRPGERVVCHRGDKEPRPGEIITHIIENLVLSEIAIADLTGKNPNVFYELGVRHAVNDNTILIAQSEDDVPFDLRGLRFITYTKDFQGGPRLRNAITAAVEDIVKQPEKIDNPVRRFLIDHERRKLETTGTPPGYDVVKELLREMTNLRGELATQSDQIKSIMNAVTSGKDMASTQRMPESELKFLEGAWLALPTQSVFYPRWVNGELVAPYCFGGDSRLTGRYFNFRRIGDKIFARFEWLDSSAIRGYSLWTIESPDRIVGGWWYAEDVPPEISGDMTRIEQSLPGMNRTVLERLPKKTMPQWAEDYFKRHGKAQ